MDIGRAYSVDPAPVVGFDGQKLTSLPVEAALRVSAYLQAVQEQGVTVSVRPGPQAPGPCSHDAVVASYDPDSRSLDVPGLALDGSGAGRRAMSLTPSTKRSARWLLRSIRVPAPPISKSLRPVWATTFWLTSGLRGRKPSPPVRLAISMRRRCAPTALIRRWPVRNPTAGTRIAVCRSIRPPWCFSPCEAVLASPFPRAVGLLRPLYPPFRSVALGLLPGLFV